jgi:hypothetical protein
MSLQDKLISLTEQMHNIILAQDGVEVMHTEEFGWENYRYSAKNFRLAHIERYFVDGLVVAHVTCFPRKDNGSPIFGFDVVGSEKTDKITGAFIDWSPTLTDGDWHNTTWSLDRKLPVWAKCFSNQFIAIRPNEDEHEKLFSFAIDTFAEYMMMLNASESVALESTEVLEVIKKAQNYYCEHQSQNPRTFAALSHKIGEDRAKYFMTEILFPEIQ